MTRCQSFVFRLYIYIKFKDVPVLVGVLGIYSDICRNTSSSGAQRLHRRLAGRKTVWSKQPRPVWRADWNIHQLVRSVWLKLVEAAAECHMYEQWVIQLCGCGSCVIYCRRVPSRQREHESSAVFLFILSAPAATLSEWKWRVLLEDVRLWKSEQDPFQNNSKGPNSEHSRDLNTGV